ncbi:PRC-barrel domain containing protein [Sinomonas halotolerans]|uniref:PRC-barrel domain containing protein n=1 Tax=Sinomonas halotolerans TaxID=1644133 RepID=A0ABU9WZ75_9MICC
MLLTDLLGSQVRDPEARLLGVVSDVRFALDTAPGSTVAPLLADARLVGIIVSPRTSASFLGFERQGLTQPWPIAQLLRRWHRGSFLVLWGDFSLVDGGEGKAGVALRPGYTAYEATLMGPSEANELD